MKVTDAEVEAATKAANAVRISYEDRLTSLPEGVWTAYDEKVARVALLAASQARALSSGDGWSSKPQVSPVEADVLGMPAQMAQRVIDWYWPPSKDNTNE